MAKQLNVIVLCGGFGTRIKSSIGNIPKILAIGQFKKETRFIIRKKESSEVKTVNM